MKFINSKKIFLLIIVIWWHIASASEPWLIHEPYWRYTQEELAAYAKRIYKTITPHFIKEDQVDAADGQVLIGNERIKVLKEVQFGRVLPSIFLQEVLARISDTSKAVPRIFLLPKRNMDIKFNFLLPHQGMSCHAGHNCIQVESDSFEIYKEYIEGEGKVGDKSFFPFGHADFNAKQIITSSKDGKKYLIDTKEEKNFFLPALSPYKDGFAAYWLFKIGRNIPQQKERFETWQYSQKMSMIRDASKNFAQATSTTINLGPAHLIDIGGIDSLNYAAEVFDDNNESERYFLIPNDNVARYLYLGRVDLLKQLAQEQGKMSLHGITIPFRDYSKAYDLNPVQFALKNPIFSHADILTILQIFAEEHEYFSNAAASESDIEKWPLYLALRTGNKEIFFFVVDHGADIHGKVGAHTILTHAVSELIGREAHEDLEAIFSRLISGSSQINIHETLMYLLSDVKKRKQEKIAIAKRIMKHLQVADEQIVLNILNLGHESMIESILDSHYDYKSFLLAAMKKIRDPSHEYLRWAQGDSSGINYFWYELVKKILAQKSQYPEADVAIDNAIEDAMDNSKVNILEELLQHKPHEAPQMMRAIRELKQQPYGSEILMDHAIEQRCALVVQLLGEHGFPVSISQIRKALRVKKSDVVMDALIKAKNINLQGGLNEAIDYGDFSAAKKFLLALYQRGITPSSVNYQKIFQSSSAELKAMAEGLTKTSSSSARPSFMGAWEVEKIVKEQDLKTLNYLIDHDINLGDILVKVVRHIIFAKDNKTTIGTAWWDVLDKLKVKDLPADALDQALASALVNSQHVIMELFLGQLNKIKNIRKEHQQVRAEVRQIIRDRYMRNVHFEEALSLRNLDLVEIYIDEGMPVQPKHLLQLPWGKNREEMEQLLRSAMPKNS